MREDEINRIILTYLEKKGYKSAASGLRSEGNVQSVGEMAFQGDVDLETSVTSHVILFNTTEGATSQYDEEYTRLRDWVQSSLDLYRPELMAVLFPIFVHCFLDLVCKGLLEEAQKFFQKHREEHDLRHEDDTRRLQGIANSAHLEENDTAQLFLQYKFSVRLSSYSFELLIHFLQDAQLVLILAIVNKHVDFKVFRGHPQQILEEEEGLGVLTGQTPQAVRQLHQKEVRWGTLEESEYLRSKEEEEKRRELEGPSAKKKKEDTGTGKIKSVVPLPKLDEAVEKELLEDARKRVTITSTALPSICFFTFLNTHHNLNCVEVSMDGSLVAAGMGNSSVRIWDLDPGDTVGTQVDHHSRRIRLSDEESDCLTLVGHSGPVYALSLDPQCRFLLSSSEDNTARLWSLHTKTNVVCYRGHNYPLWDVRFSPLGHYFATASHDRTARLWSTDQVHPLRIFAGHLGDVDCVLFHPNCNYLATGSTDKSVRLWDIQSGESVRLFTGHRGVIRALSFSPDGRLLASGSDDRTVMLWDLGTGRRIQTFYGHQKAVWSLSFSQEGSTLASGSADQTVRLWDINRARGLETSDTAGGTPTNLLKTFPTKNTGVCFTSFTRRNLLMAGGAFIA